MSADQLTACRSELLFQTWMAWLDDEDSVMWLTDRPSQAPDRFYVMYGGAA